MDSLRTQRKFLARANWVLAATGAGSRSFAAETRLPVEVFDGDTKPLSPSIPDAGLFRRTAWWS